MEQRCAGSAPWEIKHSYRCNRSRGALCGWNSVPPGDFSPVSSWELGPPVCRRSTGPCVLAAGCLQEASPCYFCSADLTARSSLPFSSFLSLIAAFCPVFPHALSHHLKNLLISGVLVYLLERHRTLTGLCLPVLPLRFLCLPITQIKGFVVVVVCFLVVFLFSSVLICFVFNPEQQPGTRTSVLSPFSSFLHGPHLFCSSYDLP